MLRSFFCPFSTIKTLLKPIQLHFEQPNQHQTFHCNYLKLKNITQELTPQTNTK